MAANGMTPGPGDRAAADRGTDPAVTTAIVTALLDAGVDPTIRDRNGKTAHFYAGRNPDFPQTGILFQLRDATRGTESEPEDSARPGGMG